MSRKIIKMRGVVVIDYEFESVDDLAETNTQLRRLADSMRTTAHAVFSTSSLLERRGPSPVEMNIEKIRVVTS